MENRASVTAEYMALFRALESLRPVDSRLFDDPLAHIFLRDRRKWLYGAARLNVGRWLAERFLDRAAPGARAAGIARTKWIDDEAAAVLETATQLVLLGAGFDTRAWRLTAAGRATVFELDYPETSFAKQTALREKAGSTPDRLRFLSIDFDRQPLAAVLLPAGFNPARPACFIWEGVSHYLSAQAVDSVLRQVRQVAPGCVLLFTYIDRRILETPESFIGGARLIARLQSYGEPWKFGLPPQEVGQYLAARGFELVKEVSVADVWRGAGRPKSGTRGYEFYRLASARAQP
jgi:methyltransferase (TIGR00027 family)